MYDIDNPLALRSGSSRTLWRGMYGPDREDSLVDYVRRLPRLAPNLARYIRTIRFYVAPLTARHRHRERIDAAIAAHLRSQDGFARDFQDPNVRYRPRRQGESSFRLRCIWPVPLVGAPRNLEA